MFSFFKELVWLWCLLSLSLHLFFSFFLSSPSSDCCGAINRCTSGRTIQASGLRLRGGSWRKAGGTNQASQTGKAGCAGSCLGLCVDWREGEARRPEAVTSRCRLGFAAGSSCWTCKTSLTAQSNTPRALLRAHLSPWNKIQSSVCWQGWCLPAYWMLLY